jgi:hypothetical protein
MQTALRQTRLAGSAPRALRSAGFNKHGAAPMVQARRSRARNLSCVAGAGTGLAINLTGTWRWLPPHPLAVVMRPYR